MIIIGKGPKETGTYNSRKHQLVQSFWRAVWKCSCSRYCKSHNNEGSQVCNTVTFFTYLYFNLASEPSLPLGRGTLHLSTQGTSDLQFKTQLSGEKLIKFGVTSTGDLHKVEIDSPLKPLERAQHYQFLDFRLLTSKILRE